MFQALHDLLVAYQRSREAVHVQPGAGGQDRRVFLRVPVVVGCTLFNPMFGLESEGRTINVSMDGLGLTAPVNWSESSRIRIRLESVGFESEGVVVFRKEEAGQFRYGVRLIRTRVTQILKLFRFLHRHHSGKLSL